MLVVSCGQLIHEAIGATFLRHNQFYKLGEKTSETLSVDGIIGKFKYQKKEWYVHQTFTTQLCDEIGQLLTDYIQIVSWIYPGATVRHARLEKYNKLEEKAEYVLALLFLPLVCQYFILDSNPSKYYKKQFVKYVVVIPEVTNFEISAQRCWKLRSLDYKDFYVTNLEEATLKYYSHDKIENSDYYYKFCQVLLYEKMNKSSTQRSLKDAQDIEIYEKAILDYQLICQHFQSNKVFGNENKQKLIVKVNHIRGIIAENLVKGVPWWSDFWMSCNQNGWEDLHKQLFYNRKGLISMIENDKEMETYNFFIRACHKALRRIYVKIYGRTKKGDLPRVEREYERIRG